MSAADATPVDSTVRFGEVMNPKGDETFMGAALDATSSVVLCCQDAKTLLPSRLTVCGDA
jgi:hypothetical protein